VTESVLILKPKRRYRRRGERMLIISLHIPPKMLDALQQLVDAGLYPNISEAIRHGIKLLITRDIDLLKVLNDAQLIN